MASLLLLSLWLLASVQSLESREHGRQRGPILLTDETFDKNVLNRDDIWMVLFYPPCDRCYKNFEPEWTSAAIEVKEQTKGKVKLAAVDVTANKMLANQYGVHKTPTIKIFQKEEDPVNYDGQWTKSDIVSHALHLFLEHVTAPEVLEIIDEDILRQTCYHCQQCIITFLPDILDTGAAGRNTYLELLLKMAYKYKKRKWGWLWSEAGAQSELESSLGIGGFGYPALAAVNPQRMEFALLKGSFSEEDINEFLRKVFIGEEPTLKIARSQIPNINTVEPWDGKDGELPTEEDIDLSDVDDDLDNQKDEL